MKAFRTALTVTVITLLVWALAEGQTLQRATRSVPVQIDAGSSGRAIRVMGSGWSGAVEIEMQGGAASIGRVQNELRDGLVLAVGAELSSETGDTLVDVREAISRTPTFARSGVTVRRTTPETLSIDVQPIVEMRVPVRVRVPEGVLRGEPRVTPDAVTVRVPESKSGSIPAEAYAALAGGALDRMLPGQSASRNIPVRLENVPDHVWGLELVPAEVEVSFRIRSRTETLVVPLIPVHVAMEPRFAGAWRVEVLGESAGLLDVELSGPVEAIGLVRRGEAVPLGVVRLTVDDLRPGEVEKRVELIGLPGSVLVGGDERRVRLRVSPGVEPTTVTAPPTVNPAEPATVPSNGAGGAGGEANPPQGPGSE